jgi:hypothetical protein
LSFKSCHPCFTMTRHAGKLGHSSSPWAPCCLAITLHEVLNTSAANYPSCPPRHWPENLMFGPINERQLREKVRMSSWQGVGGRRHDPTGTFLSTLLVHPYFLLFLQALAPHHLTTVVDSVGADKHFFRPTCSDTNPTRSNSLLQQSISLKICQPTSAVLAPCRGSPLYNTGFCSAPNNARQSTTYSVHFLLFPLC